LGGYPLASKFSIKQFFRGAKNSARLNHPNIASVYEAGEQNGYFYYTMELLKGETIGEILYREHRLGTHFVLSAIQQVCKGLEYAHSNNVIHRNIKPANLFWITEKRQVKIIGLGLSIAEGVKASQEIAVGTPNYMSPEQVLGWDLDQRSDIYSLGVTMFEMLTGRCPFEYQEAAFHHVHTNPPAASDFTKDVPLELSNMILKCMDKKPENRYQSFWELDNDLARLSGLSFT
jgi:serine/threonine-protein kinase